jgi:hypothetical protein
MRRPIRKVTGRRTRRAEVRRQSASLFLQIAFG